jgi:hypothetical protein
MRTVYSDEITINTTISLHFHYQVDIATPLDGLVDRDNHQVLASELIKLNQIESNHAWF